MSETTQAHESISRITLRNMRPLLLALALLPLAAGAQATSPTLDSIRKANTLTCGIDQSEAEFSMTDEHGPRVAFDTDLCKAVAAAILGPHAQLSIKGYPDNETALAALRRREVDLIASVSDDFSHATLPGVTLSQPVLYDAIGLLVPRAAHVTRIADLSGKKICFLDQTEAEEALHSWFAAQHLTLVPFPFQEEGEMEAAFVTGNCTALAGDLTRLAAARTAFGASAGDYVLLGETLAFDPVAMASRSDDPAFAGILCWTFNLLLAADEREITAASLKSQQSSNDTSVRRMLGLTRELGRPLSLRDDWPISALSAAGSYSEIFDRDLGSNSPLRLSRGPNAPVSRGGLLQALPFK